MWAATFRMSASSVSNSEPYYVVIKKYYFTPLISCLDNVLFATSKAVSKHTRNLYASDQQTGLLQFEWNQMCYIIHTANQDMSVKLRKFIRNEGISNLWDMLKMMLVKFRWEGSEITCTERQGGWEQRELIQLTRTRGGFITDITIFEKTSGTLVLQQSLWVSVAQFRTV